LTNLKHSPIFTAFIDFYPNRLKGVLKLVGVTCEIKLKRGEPVEKALRRLKKVLDREGVLKEMRARRHFEKPGDKRRKKQARARSRARRFGS